MAFAREQDTFHSSRRTARRLRLATYQVTGCDPLQGDRPSLEQLAARLEEDPLELLTELDQLRQTSATLADELRAGLFYRVLFALVDLAVDTAAPEKALKAQQLFWSLADRLLGPEQAAEEPSFQPTDYDPQRVLEFAESLCRRVREETRQPLASHIK
jgi:hypothetical protein